MNRTRRRALCALAVGLATAGASAWAAPPACTATFTGDGTGTFPNTMKFDRATGVLTVDLSGVPKDAAIFRAELMLNRGRGRGVFRPTLVHPVGQPAGKLKFVAPRFVSLDALEAVRAAVRAGGTLKLKVAQTLAGVRCLEVSFTGGRPKAAEIPNISGLKVTHRKGQSLIVFAEPKLEAFGDFKTGGEVGAFAKDFRKKHAGMSFRIWRSAARITPETIAQAALVGECGFFTCWNSTYHQSGTAKRPPIRYRVTDDGEEVPWGTGIYAHNPAAAGKAYYAVTVAVNGEEDFGGLGAGNTTSEAVEETTGMGEPILQWIERVPKGKEWMYHLGPLTRLIYTRWESPGPPASGKPHCSFPSNPIDYLVAMGDLTKEQYQPPEAWKACYRVEPAPVGLHLHCWGGSLNGGYGWWYNGGRGAILIASNQIPYDWWTGYHESRGTARTYGDGHVRPFSMNRVLGFLDWAATQWTDGPEIVRKTWRKLDLTRVFTAGNSMGGAGAPMFPIRYGARVAWCNAWVGVHVPEKSPGFAGSYRGSYGPRHQAITMPDGKTSPWDFFSDVWWLRKHVKAETGFIIASNGKSDSGIGWPQAYEFARALQETRRPHLFNWGPGGHGTRSLIGPGSTIDIRTDQSLPAFTNGTLDQDIGTGRMKAKDEIAAEREKIAAGLKAGGKKVPKRISVLPTDGAPAGAYNRHLWWDCGTVVDTPSAWEMTVILKASAPKDSCKVDLTPRRLQRLKTPAGRKFTYRVTDSKAGKVLAEGTAAADRYDLLTLKQIPLVKGENRVKIEPLRIH